MSPNQVIPVENGALSPIAERVLKVPSLTYEYDKGGIVIAHKTELLVRASALESSDSFRRALMGVAEPVGTLADLKAPPTERVTPPGSPSAEADPTRPDPDYEPDPDGPLSQVQIWRLNTHAKGDSIDQTRQLRPLAAMEPLPTHGGGELLLPAISPNHTAILSPSAGGCPAAPPTPAADPDEAFVKRPSRESTAKVTVLDSGYIWIDPPHRHLDERVTVVRGQWLDASTTPATWQPDRPDGLYTDPAGQLDGISGHGTFIAGLIAHIAPHTRLEVVGLRNQEVEIGDLDPATQLGLFETEVAIAHAMLRRSRTDVIQCGFAFPTLDDYPSLPFAAVMAELRQSHAPHEGRVAVVAPAGNEQSARRFWPAALPDVIGVASTNRRGNARGWFSNWGNWCDCCTRGEYVYSTFVRWDGPVEGEPISDIEHFQGWARWDGTSFAAPKVSAAIARLFTERGGTTPPLDAGNELVAGTGGVAVSSLTDATLSGASGRGPPVPADPIGVGDNRHHAKPGSLDTRCERRGRGGLGSDRRALLRARLGDCARASAGAGRGR